MFKNILLGYDDSRCSRVALRYAIELCDRFRARLHVLAVTEQWEWETLAEGGEAAKDPAEYAIEEPEEHPLADSGEAHEALAIAGEACSEAGIGWSAAAVHGDPATRLGERSRLADLVIIGREGISVAHNGVGAPPQYGGRIGRCTRKVIAATQAPVFVASREHVDLRSVLAKYVRTPEGGRTLRTAGALAACFNLRLDVLACGHDHHEADTALREARRYLLAYGQEGIYRALSGPTNSHLSAAATDLDASLVVVPVERHRLLGVIPRTEALSAFDIPGVCVLIQP